MSRRFGLLVPVVFLALLVQVLAPIRAVRMLAASVADPLSGELICSGHDGTQSLPDDTPPPHAVCPLCSFALAGVVGLDPPQPTFAILQQRSQRVAWLAVAATAARSFVSAAARARAPAAIS